eukprot:6199912-Pleurochrysis_carterae.AAC.1
MVRIESEGPYMKIESQGLAMRARSKPGRRGGKGVRGNFPKERAARPRARLAEPQGRAPAPQRAI